jgi:hypothetical protein
MNKETSDKIDSLISEAQKFTLLNLSIKTLLECYSKTLIGYEKELKEYRENESFAFLVEMKKEHVDELKGKIEVLTYLNEKA